VDAGYCSEVNLALDNPQHRWRSWYNQLSTRHDFVGLANSATLSRAGDTTDSAEGLV
jgi:hypothetical protein